MKRLSIALIVVAAVALLCGCAGSEKSNISQSQAAMINEAASGSGAVDLKGVKYITTQFNLADWERYGDDVQKIYITSERDAGINDDTAISVGCQKYALDKTRCIAAINGLTQLPEPSPTPETNDTQIANAISTVQHSELTSAQKQMYADRVKKMLDDKSVSDIAIVTDTATGLPIAVVQLKGTLPMDQMDNEEMLDVCRIVAGRINECGIDRYRVELVDSNSQLAMTYDNDTE